MIYGTLASGRSPVYLPQPPIPLLKTVGSERALLEWTVCWDDTVLSASPDMMELGL